MLDKYNIKVKWNYGVNLSDKYNMAILPFLKWIKCVIRLQKIWLSANNNRNFVQTLSTKGVFSLIYLCRTFLFSLKKVKVMQQPCLYGLVAKESIIRGRTEAKNSPWTLFSPTVRGGDEKQN